MNSNPTLEFRFLSPESKSLFPLQRISDLEKLFEIECAQEDPNLAVLSIILGAVENSLVALDYSKAMPVSTSMSTSTGSRRKSSSGGGGKRKKGKARPGTSVEFKEAIIIRGDDSSNKGVDGSASLPVGQGQGQGADLGVDIDVDQGGDDGMSDKENNVKGDFPPVEYDLVEALFLKFYHDVLRKYIDLKEFGMEEGFEVENSPRGLVQLVSDVVWSGLARSYNAEAPHIQSLYTYLIGQKLDRIGVSLAVTAGCQLLGLRDVHLVMSEDHSWLGFGGVDEGNCPKQTVEVTWHGKGVEDKRGQEVRVGDDEDSWIYQKGHAVYCSRHMEIAAMVASINSTISGNMSSVELIQIQQRLLWQLYENGHLKKYPNGLMTLAELEEMRPTSGKPLCPSLYKDAVLSSRTYYADMHIFPYTTYAAYAFRHDDFKSALKYWAHGARIIQQYRRSLKNDEEIYREFFEISTDALVTVMKSCSTGFAANSIVRDPMCFAHLLRFFDGICAWEERSKSSVIHSTWAKAWIQAIGRFDYTIRRLVRLSESAPGKGRSNNENGTMEDELEKDSGIDEEDEPSPRVTLFSAKMWQINHFFKLEKFNPNEITLNLLAEPSVGEASVDKNETKTNLPGGRPRRERSSQSTDSKMDVDEDSSDSHKAPITKRAKLSVS